MDPASFIGPGSENESWEDPPSLFFNELRAFFMSMCEQLMRIKVNL